MANTPAVPINLRAIFTWVKRQHAEDPNAVVGVCRSATGCLVAEYLRSLGVLYPSVSQYTIRFDDQNRHHARRPAPSVRALIASFDGRFKDGMKVTAAEALPLFEELL